MQEALDRGFWHSLMGLLSIPGRATVNKVIELAGNLPIPTVLSRPDATRLLNLGKLAKTAGKLWWDIGSVNLSQIPMIELPPVPNIDGGLGGKFQGAFIIKPPTREGRSMNIVFSSDVVPDKIRILDMVKQFLIEQESHYSRSEGGREFLDYLRKIEGNWMEGRGDLTVPNWLIRDMSEEE